MGIQCYGVSNKENHLRYFYSRLKAEEMARRYKTDINYCYNISKWLIEDKENIPTDEPFKANIIEETLRYPKPINHIPGVIQ